jgi:hypothetical protein
MAELDPLSPFVRQEKVLDTFNQGTNQQLAIGREGLIKDVLARRAAKDAFDLEGEKGRQTRANTALNLGIIGNAAADEFAGGRTPDAMLQLRNRIVANNINALGAGLEHLANVGEFPDRSMANFSDFGAGMYPNVPLKVSSAAAGTPPVMQSDKTTQNMTTKDGSKTLETTTNIRGFNPAGVALGTLIANQRLGRRDGGIRVTPELNTFIPSPNVAAAPGQPTPAPQPSAAPAATPAPASATAPKPLGPQAHATMMLQLAEAYRKSTGGKELPDGMISVLPDGTVMLTDGNGRQTKLMVVPKWKGLSKNEEVLRE